MTGSGQGHTRNWMCALKRVIEVDAITCKAIVNKNRLSDDHDRTSQKTSQHVWRTGVPARPKDKFWEEVPTRRTTNARAKARRRVREPPNKQACRFSISFVKIRNYARGKLGKAGKAGGGGKPVSAVDVLLSDGPVRSVVLEVHSQKL